MSKQDVINKVKRYAQLVSEELKIKIDEDKKQQPRQKRDRLQCAAVDGVPYELAERGKNGAGS